uniref:Uncharacterized protein n=1 Tax=Anopheles culicifacies TaxID=139723 RepID=A0A182MA07_9DIPT
MTGTAVAPCQKTFVDRRLRGSERQRGCLVNGSQSSNGMESKTDPETVHANDRNLCPASTEDTLDISIPGTEIEIKAPESCTWPNALQSVASLSIYGTTRVDFYREDRVTACESRPD